MILLAVAAAHLLIFVCEAADVEVAGYYLLCSLSYCLVAAAALFVWTKTASVFIFWYVVVNYIAAVLNYFLSTPTGYDMFRFFHFGAFQTVAFIVECLVIVQGGRCAYISLRSLFVRPRAVGTPNPSLLGRGAA